MSGPHNAERWRGKAAKMLELAEGMRDAQARQSMVLLAAEYSALAEAADAATAAAWFAFEGGRRALKRASDS